MKTAFIILVLLISNIAIGQVVFKTENITPILSIKNREVLLSLEGKLEIDGHTFENKKSKDPIQFTVDLKGIKIFNSKGEYDNRDCDNPKCDIIHLVLKNKYKGFIISTNPSFLLSN